MVALMLKTTNCSVLSADLERQFGIEGESPNFFDQDALLIDFSALSSESDVPDVAELVNLLRRYRLVPVAARGGNTTCQTAARQAGLFDAAEAYPVRHQTLAQAATVVKEVIREVRIEVPVEVQVEVPVAGPGTMVVDKPLRSGQKIYARGCDLVVLAMVNQGAEVVADGNIHVYAPLRGKAMAGARGNTSARIFSICLEPELISIAGIYRTSETPLPEAVSGRPGMVRLGGDELDKLIIEPLSAH